MKDFKYQEAVDRVAEFLDSLAHRAWEPFHKDDPDYPRATSPRDIREKADLTPIKQVHEALGYGIGRFISELKCAPHKLPPEPRRGAVPHGEDVGIGNWRGFFDPVLLDIIGSSAATSVADATVKATAFMAKLKAGWGGHQRYSYRGQRRIDWPLLPVYGRIRSEEMAKGTWEPPTDTTSVTREELRSLLQFMKQWPVAGADDIDKRGTPGPNAFQWWCLKQHYDQEKGTRLLDTTSSLLFALLFACVRWTDGSVADTDEEVDGVVYLFPEGQNSNVQDLATSQPPTADAAFDQSHVAPRMILNPPHNERSKAQGGGYLWWPRFWEPLPIGQIFYLRVPRENKRDIARELLSFGVGPKEAVRGKRGLQNETALRKDLGLPAWKAL